MYRVHSRFLRVVALIRNPIIARFTVRIHWESSAVASRLCDGPDRSLLEVVFAGVQLAVSSLVMRDAARSLLDPTTVEAVVGQWFGWLICAFLFGAATGGYLFGWSGDRIGRALWHSASCATAFFQGSRILFSRQRNCYCCDS